MTEILPHIMVQMYECKRKKRGENVDRIYVDNKVKRITYLNSFVLEEGSDALQRQVSTCLTDDGYGIRYSNKIPGEDDDPLYNVEGFYMRWIPPLEVLHRDQDVYEGEIRENLVKTWREYHDGDYHRLSYFNNQVIARKWCEWAAPYIVADIFFRFWGA